jgi:hypothetical protein
MFRFYLIGAALLGLVSACAGLIMAYQFALDTAYARGQAAGRAQINGEIQHELDVERNASAEVTAEANRKVSSLEQERARLQVDLDAAAEAGRNSRISDRACLDAGLMRALNRIGFSPAGSGASP